MTFTKSIYHQDPIEISQESMEKSKVDFMSFSEEKFRQDVLYHGFLITSAKYLNLPYLPRRFSEDS